MIQYPELFRIVMIECRGKINLIKAKSLKLLILIASLIVIGLPAISCVTPTGTGGGCAGPGAQGWSGFINDNGILYMGSMKGEVLALDPALIMRLSAELYICQLAGKEVVSKRAIAPVGMLEGPLA